MKLNNKKTGIACMIGVAVLASSCSDWLDPKPLSFYTPEISFADYNGLKTGTDMSVSYTHLTLPTKRIV